MTPHQGLIVSVSGIRGVVGQGLTPEAATAFAAALGTWTQGGRIVLSRDGRPSGSMLRHAVLAGLLGAGWGVEWCVMGLDRNWAFNPACKMARP